MRALARLRRSWAAVRPRTRRGMIRSVVAIAAGAAVLSVVLFVGAAMAWSPYLDFSLNRESDARARAALPLSYAAGSSCGDCHQAEAGRLATAGHANIGCQSCHGALAEHVDTAEAGKAAAVQVATPTDAVCVKCHTQVVGRPDGFKQIVPSQHYISQCLACHDPHTAIAKRPPVVQHPLDNLPPCLTCHGPEGFKARNQRHPEVTNDDRACLECHAAGRGPAQDQVSQ